IAKSGTKAFMEQIKKAKDETELIGQFGVGFYSAFMVANKIELHTRKAGEEKGYKWISEAKEEFTLEESKKENSGTDIILYLKSDMKEFCEESKLKELVKKYSDFIEHPVVMDIEKEEKIKDKEGKDTDKTEKIINEEILNSQKAIWTRSKSEIKEEEYHDFYKHITHDFENPLLHLHQHFEGTLEFKTLLYIPQKAPFDLFQPESKYGLNLYIKRVFISNDCEALLPQYLRFVKGVVDSSDLPLNVSREILQDNPLLHKIKKNVVKKILSSLISLKEKDFEKYLKFYKAFGKVLKEGLHFDHDNKESLLKLVLFESSKTKADEYRSLENYVKDMPKDQKEIYYISGENRSIAENSPKLEAFLKKGYEVLFLIDPIDEWVTPHMQEFEGKKIISVANADISEEKTEEEKKSTEKKEKGFASLFDFIKETLKEDIKEVKASSRLTDSPVCLASDAMSSQMERMMQQMNPNMPKAQKTLEVNVDHSILKNMKKIFSQDPKNKELVNYSKLLLDQALLSEGMEVKDRKFFLEQMNNLMKKGL
ncbi:molecular chaperone HtpG, partial [Candidatus Peregrinibacteria bacterium]|nr:molecular chaperone HtpG [Candidatus Peregrinibacteria bacterium]